MISVYSVLLDLYKGAEDLFRDAAYFESVTGDIKNFERVVFEVPCTLTRTKIHCSRANRANIRANSLLLVWPHFSVRTTLYSGMLVAVIGVV